MKRHLSLSGVVLGLLAAALVGCGDEEASKPEQTKSAITSRGFAANGCSGTGVFDINSNNLINYVALDQSSFSDVNASVFALDKNNQEQLISNSQNSSAISSSLASILNEASNFQSAFQRAEQFAAQASSAYQNAYANNQSESESIAQTRTTTNHDAESFRRQFTRTQASGYNNTRSSNDANSYANRANQASSYDAARSAAFNAISSDATNFANAAQSAAAINAARNSASSARNAGSANDSSADSSRYAANGANNSANQFATRAVNTGGGIGAADVGWGWGGFGWGDVSSLSSFNNSSVFNSQFANAFNNARAAQNNSAYADLDNNQFSKVFSNANRNSYDQVGSNARNAAYSNRFNAADTANQVASQSNLHNDQSASNSYNNGTFNEVANGSREHAATDDSATQYNALAQNNATRSARAQNALARNSSRSAADQLRRNNSRSSSQNSQYSKQYQALDNLSQYNANSLVLRVNVTANSESAVLSVFTGNNANSVSANQDFAQSFAGCGVGASVVGGKKLTPIAPAAADAADEMAIEPLGDRVAKPE
jgi:hypothetical protein